VSAHLEPGGIRIKVDQHASYLLHPGQYFDHFAAGFSRSADTAYASGGFYKLWSCAGPESFDQNISNLPSAPSSFHPRGQGIA
jgi:hypothetical protein